MHLPPTFFDMSVHLVVRLVHQIKLLGPIFLHQMFPFERLMSVLRKYIQNRYMPEGCMAEGWSTKEALEFCIQYLVTLGSVFLCHDMREGYKERGLSRRSMYVLVISVF